MKWTKRKPDRVGYWWYKNKLGNEGIIVELVFIRNLDEKKELMCLSNSTRVLCSYGLVKYITGYWSDSPIEEPERE